MFIQVFWVQFWQTDAIYLLFTVFTPGLAFSLSRNTTLLQEEREDPLPKA